MDSTQFTHISLCSGYGGIDLGLRRMLPSLRTIAYAEIEEFACGLLASRMEAGQLDSAPIWTNVKTFPWSQFHRKVHILSGGYPCQPFSAAGKRLGKDDPRHLWPFIADGVRAMQPELCFFENVEGHISLGLREVVGDLESLGYTATWGLFSAAEVGAPHQRKRVFILAHRNDAGLEGYHHRHSPAVSSQDVGANAWPGGKCDVWPSRPGQPQHGWEPPRVVGQVQLGNASELQRDGGHDNARVSQRSQAVSQPRNASGQEPMGNANNGRQSSGIHAGCGGKKAGGGQNNAESSNGSVGNASGEGRGKGRNTAGEGQGLGLAWADGSNDERSETQPTLGGNANGAACGLDYAQLCVSGDNRTDELRLLGNGVVPATAERAFRTLMERLL